MIENTINIDTIKKYFKEQNEAEKEGCYYIPAITYRRDKNGRMYDIKVDLNNIHEGEK